MKQANVMKKKKKTNKSIITEIGFSNDIKMIQWKADFSMIWKKKDSQHQPWMWEGKIVKMKNNNNNNCFVRTIVIKRKYRFDWRRSSAHVVSKYNFIVFSPSFNLILSLETIVNCYFSLFLCSCCWCFFFVEVEVLAFNIASCYRVFPKRSL